MARHDVVPLMAHHGTSEFQSGNAELDSWLGRAWDLQGRDAVRVYVVLDGESVIGYSGLVVGSVGSIGLPSRARGGLGDVPVLLLGKLAVDAGAHGTGVGSVLLGHAARQAVTIRGIAGVRLLAAHPIDEAARAWYVHKGMSATSDGSLCYTRIKDLAD